MRSTFVMRDVCSLLLLFDLMNILFAFVANFCDHLTICWCSAFSTQLFCFIINPNAMLSNWNSFIGFLFIVFVMAKSSIRLSDIIKLISLYVSLLIQSMAQLSLLHSYLEMENWTHIILIHYIIPIISRFMIFSSFRMNEIFLSSYNCIEILTVISYFFNFKQDYSGQVLYLDFENKSDGTMHETTEGNKIHAFEQHFRANAEEKWCW